MMIFIIVLHLLFADFIHVKTELICNADDGPAGTYGCVLLTPYYQKYQPSTCLTDAYIMEKSKGRYICRNKTTYCWYQCMVELHDMEEGPVFDDCACEPNVTISTVTLDPSCYSPSGDSCTWYKNCLEKRHHCEGTNHSYAIEFATKFCNNYNENYNRFTETGQSWIDAVRKCLQVTLVPLIRPYSHATCQDIKTKAVESHPSCYLKPFPGKPSICDLSCDDWWNVFWTVREASCSMPSESVDGMVKVFSACASSASCAYAAFGTKVVNVNTAQNLKNFSIPTCNLVDAIANKLHWNNSYVIWHAFTDFMTSAYDDLLPVIRGINYQDYEHIFTIFITGKHDIRSIVGRSVIDLDKIIEDFGNAVRDGRMFFTHIDGISQPVYINRMSVCEDFNCSRTTHQFRAPASPNPSTDASTEVRSNPNAVISVIGCVFVAIAHYNAGI